MEATTETLPCVCRAVEGLSFLRCDGQSYCPPERTEEHPGDQSSTAPETSRLQPPAAPGLSSSSRGGAWLEEVGP